MSRGDAVWYGRVAVWIGTALLLLMAVTGTQIPYVSVVAVAAIVVGLILLVWTIPWGRVIIPTASVPPVEAEPDTVTEMIGSDSHADSETEAEVS